MYLNLYMYDELRKINSFQYKSNPIFSNFHLFHIKLILFLCKITYNSIYKTRKSNSRNLLYSHNNGNKFT